MFGESVCPPLEVYIVFCLADRGHCHLYNAAQYSNTNTLHIVKSLMEHANTGYDQNGPM